MQPLGWTEKTSLTTDRKYYINDVTKTSTWRYPTCSAERDAAHVVESHDKPPIDPPNLDCAVLKPKKKDTSSALTSGKKKKTSKMKTEAATAQEFANNFRGAELHEIGEGLSVITFHKEKLMRLALLVVEDLQQHKEKMQYDREVRTPGNLVGYSHRGEA